MMPHDSHASQGVQSVGEDPLSAVLAQVEEVRETQPDCRIYIALTKCDQLEELPSVGTVQPDPEVDGDDSTNGGQLLLLQQGFHVLVRLRSVV